MSVGVLTNLLGIEVAARVQLVLVAALVVGLVAALVVGLVAAALVSLPAADPARLTPFAPHGWRAVGSAILTCFFSFFGWVPPGGRSAEDHHEELELAVVISGDGEVVSTATGQRRPAPIGTAALMDSYERHVWHNLSADAPLVFLSIYWMPLDGPAAPT
jgi:amino acid transporter